MACTCDEVGDYAMCWIHGNVTQAVDQIPTKISHTFHRAMPTGERREKLERCFTLLSLNGLGLSSYQMGQLRKHMEVDPT